MTDCLSLIRPDLRDFAGYSSAAKEAAGAAPSIKLDANENPWPPFGSVADLCAAHRYGEPQPVALRGRMGAAWNVAPDNILLTCGSDQGIDLLVRLFCAAGKDSILVCPPTFSMYAFCARLQGASVKNVPLKEDGQLDVAAITKAAAEGVKLIFIPSPHAPMGHTMAKEDILSLCAACAGKSLIVIDEAYVEFSANPEGFAPFIGGVPNLVLLRTLSKAHALAGERVGCVIAPPALIEVLQKIAPPYPLAQSAVRAAMDAFSAAGLAQSAQRQALIKAERALLAEKIKACPEILRVYPSEGNFLLVETKDAKAFIAKLLRRGILIRSRESDRPGWARISVGTPQENDLLLAALGVSLSRESRSLRTAGVQRKTKETAIEVFVDLDRAGESRIATGIGFFNHMLDQVAMHGGFSLSLEAKGDLDVDAHHTIEDCALAFGEAVRKALGDKKGLARFGFTAPLDEAIAQVVLDLSGRPFAKIDLAGPAEPCDGMGADLASHFFQSFAASLGATLHVKAQGENNHHMIEASFKALGRALRQALAREGDALPSTKGAL